MYLDKPHFAYPNSLCFIQLVLPLLQWLCLITASKVPLYQFPCVLSFSDTLTWVSWDFKHIFIEGQSGNASISETDSLVASSGLTWFTVYHSCTESLGYFNGFGFFFFFLKETKCFFLKETECFLFMTCPVGLNFSCVFHSICNILACLQQLTCPTL